MSGGESLKNLNPESDWSDLCLEKPLLRGDTRYRGR